jgi:hypothetical protein
MSPREKRIIRNEALFREVNAHIANLEERLGSEGELMPLLCECANTGCTTVIEVDRNTFQTVRQGPRLFFVAPGHGLEEETVVGRGADYLIVRKEDGK